ncbi:hypothetical protein BU17DRAFT_68307 [Hysterangium stoloniferum]|nr:hypothetical protein BU17DRAFT_68307 [Hysterangium stoloniferum]
MLDPNPSLPPCATPSSNYQDWLLRLYDILPTEDNKNLAFKLLVDITSRMILSPSQSSLGSELQKETHFVKMAKAKLMRWLNPAWHDILDDFEQRLIFYLETSSHASSTVHLPTHLSELETYISYPQTSQDPFRPTTPYDTAATEGSLQEGSNNVPLSSQYIESGTFQFLATSDTSSDHCDEPYSSDNGMMLFHPQPAEQVNLSEQYQVLSASNSMPSSSWPAREGESFSSISTYSSLLPEQHCLPFTNQDCSHSAGRVDNPPQPSTSSRHVDAYSTVQEWSTPSNGPGDYNKYLYTSENRTPPSSQKSDLELFSSPFINGRPNESSEAIAPEEIDRYDVNGPLGEQRRPRRAFDRPPGLPLGPWIPGDKLTLVEEIRGRKTRRARKLPKSISSTGQDQRSKISCPKCGTWVLPKSLDRHMERHSNWSGGVYNAHLLCRYCFMPYSRMDLLVKHQKTDTQCVMLQYKVYWMLRKPYLEENLKLWSLSLSQARMRLVVGSA